MLADASPHRVAPTVACRLERPPTLSTTLAGVRSTMRLAADLASASGRCAARALT